MVVLSPVYLIVFNVVVARLTVQRTGSQHVHLLGPSRHRVDR